MPGADAAGRPSPAPRPGAPNGFVGWLAIGGIATLALHVAVHGAPSPDLTALALTVAAALGTAVPIRFLHRDGTEGITVDEALLVALLFAAGVAAAPILLSAATLAAFVALRSGLVKSAFNVAQSAVAAVASTAVFGAIGTGASALAPRSLAAALAAVVVYNLVASLLLGELFRRLGADGYRQALLATWRLNLLTLIANAAFGIMLAVVMQADAVAAVIAAVMIIGLHLGYRGYAGALADRRRNERLRGVTATLAESTGDPEALDRFVSELAGLFGGAAAELLIERDGRTRSVRFDRRQRDRTTRAAEALQTAIRRGVAVRVPADGAGDHRDAVAAPLRVDGEISGALAVYDRSGLGPWGQADVDLLASLASEVGVAIRNAELVASLSQETRKLGDIVAATSDGITLLDPEGRVVAWNPSMTSLTGLTEAEAAGRRWDDLLQLGARRDEARAAIDTALCGGAAPPPVDFDLQPPGGEPRWLQVTVSPVRRDGATQGAVLVLHDVTARRETEQMKSDFLATVSHELRTPLTPLKGLLTLVSARQATLPPDKLAEMVGGMRRQVDRLETLVGDLLTVADLDRGLVALNREVIDVTAVVGAAADEVATGSDRERLRVDATTSFHARADVEAVGRIMRALVGNALKHTDDVVEVAVRRYDGEVRAWVRDRGPGIAPWDRDRIFERFGRGGDVLTRPSQGPGLGLTIARALAERLGGSIEVDSTVGHGSTFTLVLPAVEAAALVA